MERKHPRFDRSRLKLRPLSERENLLDRSILLPVEDESEGATTPTSDLLQVARRMLDARERRRSCPMLIGAHVLRSGLSSYMIRMMEEKLISGIAMNGAGPIHDFEMALIGATTESVARYIQEGQFGLWEETGRINRILREHPTGGLGQILGREIWEGDYPFKETSVLAAGYRLGVPITVHVGIGYDIIHEHPDCDGAVLGATSYEDFLIFTETIRHLEGGAVLAFGSAVMAPEVFLKALAMARNVAHQEGHRISDFVTAVFDIVQLGEISEGEPAMSDPRYYFRPFKTLLLRTVRDGGASYYFRGLHRETLPRLYQAVRFLERKR